MLKRMKLSIASALLRSIATTLSFLPSNRLGQDREASSELDLIISKSGYRGLIARRDLALHL